MSWNQLLLFVFLSFIYFPMYFGVMVDWSLHCFKVSAGLRQHVQFDIIIAVGFVTIAGSISSCDRLPSTLVYKEDLGTWKDIYLYSST
jgi:hypothetical protein